MIHLDFSAERHFRAYTEPTLHQSPKKTEEQTNEHSERKQRISTARIYAEGTQQHPVNSLHPADIPATEIPLPPLHEGAFVRKLGVPVMIVATKVNYTLINHEFRSDRLNEESSTRAWI